MNWKKLLSEMRARAQVLWGVIIGAGYIASVANWTLKPHAAYRSTGLCTNHGCLRLCRILPCVAQGLTLAEGG